MKTQPINLAVNHPVNHPVNQPVNQRNNHSLKTIHFKWLFLALLILCLCSLIPDAMAADNPLENIKIVPGQTDSNDLGAIIKFFVKLIITALPFIIIIVNLLDSIGAVFGVIKDARRDQEWGKMFGHIMVILLGIGFAIFIGYIVFILLSKFDSYWTF